jgi:hypothetical protein
LTPILASAIHREHDRPASSDDAAQLRRASESPALRKHATDAVAQPPKGGRGTKRGHNQGGVGGSVTPGGWYGVGWIGRTAPLALASKLAAGRLGTTTTGATQPALSSVRRVYDGGAAAVASED